MESACCLFRLDFFFKDFDSLTAHVQHARKEKKGNPKSCMLHQYRRSDDAESEQIALKIKSFL